MKTLSKYFAFARIAAAQAASERAELFGRMVFVAVILGVFSALWRAVGESGMPVRADPALVRPGFPAADAFYEMSIAWRADGARFAIVIDGEELELWDLRSGAYVPSAPMNILFNLWKPEGHWFPPVGPADCEQLLRQIPSRPSPGHSDPRPVSSSASTYAAWSQSNSPSACLSSWSSSRLFCLAPVRSVATPAASATGIPPTSR